MSEPAEGKGAERRKWPNVNDTRQERTDRRQAGGEQADRRAPDGTDPRTITIIFIVVLRRFVFLPVVVVVLGPVVVVQIQFRYALACLI